MSDHTEAARPATSDEPCLAKPQPAAPATRPPASQHDLRPAGYVLDGSYMRKSTHQMAYRIRNQEFVGRTYDHDDSAAIVHTSNGDVYGRDQIEDVIWRRNPDDASMRRVLMGVNSGWSQ